jgi:hypothetical protein
MTEYTPFRVSEVPDSVIAKDIFAEENLSDVYTRIWEDIETARPLFIQAWDEARRNSAFVQGDQWDDEEREAHLRQNRIPYVFDQISPKVNAVLGVHSARRVEASVVPMEPGDEPTAYVANRLIKWCDQINRMDEVESEVFYDMIVKKAGCTVTRWALTDGLSGRPVVERIPIYQMMWDANSVDVSLSDAKWMARIIPISRQDAIERWPEFEEAIRNAAGFGNESTIARFEIMTPRQQYMAEAGRALKETDLRGDIIAVEHFEKARQYIYIVVDQIANELTEYDEQSQAQNHLEGLMQQYMEGDTNMIDGEGNDLVSIVTLSKDIVIQTLIFGDEAVSREVTDLPDFPYQVSFCYHDDGEYWSFVDQLIDPQMFQNRMISELDNQIGRGNKNIMTVIEAKLKRGFSIENLNREASKVSPKIPVLAHDAINVVPNQPAQSDLVPAISMAISHMTDIVGGRNALGLQENAAESGAAVRARQEAAGMARMPVFAHINSWRRKVTEMALWYMRRYLAPEQQMRILGEDGKPEWIMLEQPILDSLASARMDIVISEAVDTVTAKERQFVQVKELFQTIGPALPPDVVVTTLLEYSSLEQTTKDRILSLIPSIQQYQQQQAEQQRMQKMQQSVQDSVMKKQMKDQLEMQNAVSATQGSANPTLGGNQSTM